jgi:Ca2+-binding RTX toxin-like protein
VQFRVVYAGKPGSAPNFGLSAATDVPGGEAMPHPADLTPIAGTTKVRVNVPVPPDTERGSYDVTLTATLPNGQRRTRTQEIQVGRSVAPCGSSSPTITGTAAADRIVGTPGRDVIAGYGGDDHISAGGGNDLICAGPGDDTVLGGPGNDTLAGRGGRDMLIGGRGADLMIGGPGKDRFRR